MKPELPAHRIERLIFEFRGEKVMDRERIKGWYRRM